MYCQTDKRGDDNMNDNRASGAIKYSIMSRLISKLK